MADDNAPKVSAPDASDPGALPKESLESGAAASTFRDAPYADDEQIMQEEVLPGEKPRAAKDYPQR